MKETVPGQQDADFAEMRDSAAGEGQRAQENQRMQSDSARGKTLRRFGFEYNGMVLHEYYFAQLKPGVTVEQAPGFKAAILEQFGTFEAWHEDLMSAAKSRGIGWAICYYDGTTGQINNHFIQLHEDGNVGGFVPLVIVDVFEHAYMVDWKALGRADYLAAIHKNMNWSIVEARYQAAKSGQIFKRF